MLTKRETEICLYIGEFLGAEPKIPHDYLYLKTPVYIGEFDGYTDTKITSLYRHINPVYGEDYLVFNIIYNTRKSEHSFYDVDNDFSLISLDDVILGEHETRDYDSETNRFAEPRTINVQFNSNWLELLYAEITKPGYREWFEFTCNQYKRYYQILNKKNITWKERLEMKSIHIQMDERTNCRKQLGDIEELREMRRLGKKRWEEKQAPLNAIAKEILDEILAEERRLENEK
jgi:hypothetical protein